jgi:hypothetical protein
METVFLASDEAVFAHHDLFTGRTLEARFEPGAAPTLTITGPGPAVTGARVSPEAAAVRAVVDRLFDGMRERDVEKMRSAFADEARMFGLNAQGAVQVTSAADFIANIARVPEGVVLDEVLGDVEIRIDGPVASVWTYYDFYAGADFSHCGYNAFQMLKTTGEWKVVAITDSRRREGCLKRRG